MAKKKVPIHSSTSSNDNKRRNTKIKYNGDSIKDALLEETITIDEPSMLDMISNPLVLIDSRTIVDANKPINLNKEEIYNNTKKVGILIKYSDLEDLGNYYRYKEFAKYEEVYKIEPSTSDAFIGQNLMDCLGTGFAITKRHILTPLHVIEASNINPNALNEYCIIFDYNKSINNENNIFKKSNVFLLEKIIIKPDFLTKNELNDICIIRTKEEIPYERICQINYDEIDLYHNENYYSLGYPLGLPLKISYNEDNTYIDGNPYYYRTFLDSFQKNSGSPVFKDKPYGLIGMVIQSGFGYDFIDDPLHIGYKKQVVYDSKVLGLENGTKVLKIKNIIDRIIYLINLPEHAQPEEIDFILLNSFTNNKINTLMENLTETTPTIAANILQDWEFIKKSNGKTLTIEARFTFNKTIDLKNQTPYLYDLVVDPKTGVVINKTLSTIKPTVLKNDVIIAITPKLVNDVGLGHNDTDLYEITYSLELYEGSNSIFEMHFYSYKKPGQPHTDGDVIKIKKPA